MTQDEPPIGVPFRLRVRPWHRRWPRHYGWLRGLGYGRIKAAWHTIRIGGERLRGTGRRPPR
jgi:hypothetical protein